MPGHGPIARITRYFERLIEVIIFVVFLSFTGLILVQVSMRYLFHGGFSWSEELVSLGLYTILTLGAGLSWSRGMDMCVDFLVNGAPKPIAAVMKMISAIVILTFAAFMIYYSISISSSSVFRRTPILLWPMSYIYLIPIIGFAFLVLKVLASGLETHHKPENELI